MGFGRKMRTYFLTGSECSGCFRCIGSYVMTSGIGGGWSSGSQTSLLDIFLHNVHQQSAMSARARSECARRREFSRRDNFRDSNDVDFTKDIAKSFADRCKSRLTFKMSNATLSKHYVRRKWRFFTFAEIISRRTMNLTFPNDSRVDCVLFCRRDRVSTTLLTRDIDDRNFNAVT